jgi:ABC-type transport system involved in multi-copper enzyme maturation permease subunit
MSNAIQSDQSSANRFVTQTVALVVDAYREVNSKKLFWITMILSLLVVAAFAFVGINERGIWIFGKTIPGVWNTSIIPADQFYKFIFTQIAIPWWLGLLATILALVSVCSTFPDLLSGGSIDLYLARPISRMRLFLTKYLLGLTFAALQIGAFSLASFLVIGFCGGSWECKIFLAIPLVTLFFSYLYCMCVLIGILTRSALAALLITILFWGAVFAINATDGVLLMFRSMAEERFENQQQLVEYNQELLDRNDAMPATQRSNASEIQRQSEVQKTKLLTLESDAKDLRWWHNLVKLVKAPLPKTSETVSLMSRWLVDPTPFGNARAEGERKREARRAARGRPRDPDRIGPDDQGVQERMENEISGRAAAQIIGSSLGFEAVIVLLAAWVFCRRDY